MKSVQPKNMKWYNERLIIECLLQASAATKADIAEKTGMSITTVRTQLQALMQKKAVCTVGVPESIGGRPAEKYEIADNYAPFLFIDFGFWESTMIILSLTGKVLLEKLVSTAQLESEVVEVLKQFEDIFMIEIAVPGIPVRNGFLYGKTLEKKEHYSFPFLEQIEAHIAVEIINDLNLCAVNQIQKFPEIDHLVYLSFDSCVGMGIIIDRKLYTGHQFFAGEVGLLDYEGQVIDKWLSTGDIQKREEVICYVLELVSLVLSPQVVIVSEAKLPEKRIAATVGKVKNRIWSDQEILLTDANGKMNLSGVHYQATAIFLKKGWADQ